MPEETKEDLSALNKQIEDLLSGKKKPKNQYVEYALEQMKKCQAEFEVVKRNMGRLDEQLRAQQARAVELNAEFNKYTIDIEYWSKTKPSSSKKDSKKKGKKK